MPAPATIDDFLDLVRKSNQIDTARLDAYLQQRRGSDTLPPDPKKFAALLVRDGMLTNFQAEQFLQGRYRGFTLGGYRIIERVGAGGTGTVYLAEHEVMKRRVALKVLPPAVANDPATLERFRREAQAAAALDHPNIVRAYDFRQEGQLHVLVMEYVNGPSLEQVLQTGGPMSVLVACEYARQASLGLQHAHDAGLVHRDIKPGNLLVDPTGILKILDMGLARFAPEGQESVTKQFDDGTVMGTADYLSPEQAINLHNVDARADIYSLGATLYALLAGEAPFSSGTVTQKLLWHQMRDPTPLDQRRKEIPVEVAEIVQKMMAKDAGHRFQTAEAVAEALAPFCATTPTPQGPSRPGTSNGKSSSPYVRSGGASGGPSSDRKIPPPAVPDREAITDRPVRRAGPEDEHPTGSGEMPAVQAGGMMGLLALIGVMLGVLLLVGGVIGFLIFGPSPTVTSDPIPEPPDPFPRVVDVAPPPPPPPPKPPPPPPKLPDVVGEIFKQPNAHAKGLERVAFAPDGRRLATSGQDRLVKLWDVITHKPVGQIGGHEQDVFTVRFGSKGATLLSASADGTARLWQVGTRKETKRLVLPDKRGAWAAAFGRNENEVLTASEDGLVRLWNIQQAKVIRELKGHTAPVHAVVFRGGKHNHAVSASFDQTLKVFDLGNGKTVRTLTGHTGPCTFVATTADGKVAVSSSHDATVRVWDLDSGKSIHTFPGHKGAVWSVAVTPDGRRALSAGADKTVRLWDLKRKQLERTFEGHTNGVTGVAFTPDAKHFASCSLDQSFRVWGLPPVKP